MIRLSAFADEISPDLDEQLAVLEREQIAYLDLRGAWNTNVLDFSDEQVRTIQEKLAANNIQVAAIASPIGKTPIDRPFAANGACRYAGPHLLHILYTHILFLSTYKWPGK